jgi:hypothetical protein
MGEKRRRAPLLEKLEPGSLEGANGNKPRSGPAPDKIYNDINHAVGQAWLAACDMLGISIPKPRAAKKSSSGGSKKKKSFWDNL